MSWTSNNVTHSTYLKLVVRLMSCDVGYNLLKLLVTSDAPSAILQMSNPMNLSMRFNDCVMNNSVLDVCVRDIMKRTRKAIP